MMKRCLTLCALYPQGWYAGGVRYQYLEQDLGESL